MKLEDRYMYTVVPRTPIRNIIKGKAITRATNLQLTKDEVKACLKYGAVYRKFYCESNPERVTTSNLERLHRKEHLTESQFEALNSKAESEGNDEDFLKNGEEEQLSIDKSEESVPQTPDKADEEKTESSETGDDEPVEEQNTADTKDETSEPEIVFDTEGDFLKKDDEEQSYTEDESETGDDEPVEEQNTTEQLTQKQAATNNYNQKNNNGRRKNKNKQKNQPEEKKVSQQTE